MTDIALPTRASCTRCELHTVARSVGTPSLHLPDSLPPSPKVSPVIFVGRNPGPKEDEQGLPFVGPSGALVRGGRLGKRDVPGVYVDGFCFRERASVYVTNTVRCYTHDNAVPTNPHATACFPYLIEDLRTILEAHAPSPAYIVLLGGYAVSQFTKRCLGKSESLNDAFRDNGRHVHLCPPDLESVEPSDTTHPCYVFFTYHSTYLLRYPNARATVVDHLRLLSDHLANALPPVSAPTITPCRAPRPRKSP